MSTGAEMVATDSKKVMLDAWTGLPPTDRMKSETRISQECSRPGGEIEIDLEVRLSKGRLRDRERLRVRLAGDRAGIEVESLGLLPQGP